MIDNIARVINKTSCRGAYSLSQSKFHWTVRPVNFYQTKTILEFQVVNSWFLPCDHKNWQKNNNEIVSPTELGILQDLPVWRY